MTPEQIAADIERGLEIRKEIGTLEEELKQIEARLKIAGQNGEQVPLQDPNREGRQFLGMGRRHRLPIRFESDLICGSLDPDSPELATIKKLTGDLFPRFFKPSSKYDRVPKDGESFRKIARSLLTPDAFAEVIRAATSRDKNSIAKSRVVVAWDDAVEV